MHLHPRNGTLTVQEVMFQLRNDHLTLHKLHEFMACKGVRKTAREATTLTSETTPQLLPEDALLLGQIDDGSDLVETIQSQNFDTKPHLSFSPSDPILSAMQAIALAPEISLHDLQCEFLRERNLQQQRLTLYNNNNGDDDDGDAHNTTESQRTHIPIHPDIRHRLRERLRTADERTRKMTQTEYMQWTEYRQASFTYKKGRKFRDWLLGTDGKTKHQPQNPPPSNANHLKWDDPIACIKNIRIGDEAVEVLGFLAVEMVGSIVQACLKEHKESLVGLKASQIHAFYQQVILTHRHNSLRCSQHILLG